WLVCLVFSIMAARDAATPFRMTLHTLLCGLACGLALLTKGTAYTFCAPFLLWLAISTFRRLKARAFSPLLGAPAIALLVNRPYFVRNIQTFHWPLGPGQENASGPYAAGPYNNATYSPAAVASNLIKNAALELIIPWQPWDDALDSTVRTLHRILH